MKIPFDLQEIFTCQSEVELESLCLKLFRFQYENNPVYQTYADYINRPPSRVNTISEIPFLPLEFFKTHRVRTLNLPDQIVFTSSGTTGAAVSKHYLPDIELYRQTFLRGFEQFYGKIEDYVVLALLPSYLERSGSSLVYMVNAFIQQSRSEDSGFYLNEHRLLAKKLRKLDQSERKVLLIGVSFALLDLIETESFQLKNTIVMETGGMKGRRKEITRNELHDRLKKGFGVSEIHSEYGMTELLSQAYAPRDGYFFCPSTLRVLIREIEDPFSYVDSSQTGGINLIDLANLYSCSFISTEDLGKKHPDNSFEVIGRLDRTAIRGCSLLLS